MRDHIRLCEENLAATRAREKESGTVDLYYTFNKNGSTKAKMEIESEEHEKKEREKAEAEAKRSAEKEEAAAAVVTTQKKAERLVGTLVRLKGKSEWLEVKALSINANGLFRGWFVLARQEGDDGAPLKPNKYRSGSFISQAQDEAYAGGRKRKR